MNYKDNIQDILDAAEKRGHTIRIRDISYSILRLRLSPQTAYTVIFGVPVNENDVEDYETSLETKFLNRHIWDMMSPKETEKSDEDIIKELKNIAGSNETNEQMSFEDNREGIERQIEEILELKGVCPKEDIKTMALLQKTEADLRVKLNDKFGASEKSESQYIFPTRRYDIICPHTNRECYQMTKEDAKKHWKLTEKE